MSIEKRIRDDIARFEVETGLRAEWVRLATKREYDALFRELTEGIRFIDRDAIPASMEIGGVKILPPEVAQEPRKS